MGSDISRILGDDNILISSVKTEQGRAETYEIPFTSYLIEDLKAHVDEVAFEFLDNAKTEPSGAITVTAIDSELTQEGENVKVAALQFSGKFNILENYRHIIQQAALAKKLGAEIVVIPEYGIFYPQDMDERSDYAMPAQGNPLLQVAEYIANTLDVHLVAGSVPIQTPHTFWDATSEVDRHKNNNACFVFSPQKGVQGYYNKVNMYDIETTSPSGKKVFFRESEFIEAGDSYQVVPIDVNGKQVHIGLAICRDLRDAKLFHHANDNGADFVALVAGWPIHTQADWARLLREQSLHADIPIVASGMSGDVLRPDKKPKTLIGESQIVEGDKVYADAQKHEHAISLHNIKLRDKEPSLPIDSAKNYVDNSGVVSAK